MNVTLMYHHGIMHSYKDAILLYQTIVNVFYTDGIARKGCTSFILPGQARHLAFVVPVHSQNRHDIGICAIGMIVTMTLVSVHQCSV